MARERQVPKISRGALGKRLNLSESAVAAWENGRNIPDSKTLAIVERILKTDGLLQDIIDNLVTGEKTQEYMGRWVHIESQATTVLCFSFDVIPGLLQTEEYARAILCDEDQVTARIERQKVLTKEDAPVLVALIDESVLHRNVGGAGVMREQLDHLVEMAQRENVIVHIIRLKSAIGAKYTGTFILASYNGETEIGYMDDAISGGVVENTGEVTRLRRKFEIFRGQAINDEESIRLIREVSQSWVS